MLFRTLLKSEWSITNIPKFSPDVLHRFNTVRSDGDADLLVHQAQGVVETIRGVDKSGLENALRTHAAPTPAPTSLGEGPSKDESATSKDVSLLEYLDSTQLNCLNESDTHNIISILGNKTRNTGKSYLESDSDEQLLINLYLNQSVRIRSIVIHTVDVTYAPKTIKLAINRPALGFEDVESAAEPEMAQIFEELSPEDIANS
ncbi:hypothetical protein FS749_000810, partial [Ceratobasidium sp. UAMH 11750]